MAFKRDADYKKIGRNYKTPFSVIAESLKLVVEDAERLKAGKVLFTLKVVSPATNELGLDRSLAGLRALQAILEDKDKLSEILKRAYDENIKPVLIARLNKGGIRSLYRGGHGGRFNEVSLEEVGKTRKARDVQKRFLKRSPEELGDKWKQVYDLIASPGKIIGTEKVAGFTIEQLLNIKMKTKSNFSSVYMMAEFGTGRVADPGPRRYQSDGATAYKISPALAALGGDTSWWLSIGRSRMFAKNILKAHRKFIKMNKKARAKKRDVDTSNLFMFAQGAQGPRSIKPKHVIFDARGVVKQLAVAYEKAYKAIATDLNELIGEKVDFWPKNGFKFVGSPFAWTPTDLPKRVG